MKHLKTYNEVNEELTYHQREWLNLPRFLVAFLGKKLLGIYPMLNFRWSEMKKKTNSRKYPAIVTYASGGIPSEMKHDLVKIAKGDLPKNKMSVGMFLRDWNIYSSPDRSSGGVSSDNRPVVYITKDEIKKGDRYIGERISDEDIYSDNAFYSTPADIKSTKKHTRKRIQQDYPIVVMVAKFDNVDKIKEMEQYVGDICLELSDDFGVLVEPNFDLHGDHLWVALKIPEGTNIVFNDDLDSKLNAVGSRIVDYLEIEKFKGFEYKIRYTVKGPFYYFGKKRRFRDIIPIAAKWTNRYEHGESTLLWDRDNCRNAPHWNLSNIEVPEKYKIDKVVLKTISIILDTKD